MAKIAVLVGAGATLAEALPSRPVRDRRPPLDATFFRLCEDAELTGSRDLRSYMRGAYGIDPYDDDYTMEEVFNFIYSDAYSHEPPDGCIEAYWSLLRMYAAAIARSTNQLDGNSRYGVGAVLKSLWRSEQIDEISFITFNQDLVIEKAIEHAVTYYQKYSDIPWNIETTYGLELNFTRLRENAQTFTATSSQSIPIFKLHGSLNWTHTVRSEADPKNAIRTPSGDLHCVNDQRLYQKLRYAGGDRAVHTIPFLVPPIYAKSSRKEEVVAPLWAEASKAMSESDYLIIFGYSFPESDIDALSLLRRSYHNNDDLDEVIVIDRDPEVAAKIGELTEASAVSYYNDVPVCRSKHPILD